MEVIQLNSGIQVTHCSPTELINEFSLKSKLLTLYKSAFNIDTATIEAMLKWHVGLDGALHYFIAEAANCAVAFNYYLKPANLNGVSYALSGGSMVLPSHKGSFLPLFQFSEKKILDHTDLLIGFCNSNSFKILCHPVIGWINTPSFRQLRLHIGKDRTQTPCDYHPFNNNYVIKSQVASLDRTVEFLAWRLSKTQMYHGVTNDKTGNTVIYKSFEGSIDVLTILGCSTEDEYWIELSCFFNYIMKTRPEPNGVNLFLTSSLGFSFIQDHFTFSMTDYPRFFCYRYKDGRRMDVPFFIEMIDSDTF